MEEKNITNGNGEKGPQTIGLKEKALLQSLNDDVQLIGDYLKEVSQGIINSEMTKTNWSFNASFAEDLVAKEVLQADRFDEFQKVYKTKENHACLFVVSKVLQKFIFSPYPDTEPEL